MQNIEKRLTQLEAQVQNIHARNQRVEADKNWETSWMRKGLIATLTYVVISLFFISIKTTQPFINAIVPTLGFLLSTLTIDMAKKYWLKTKK